MFTKSANWFRQELWKHRNFQQGDTLAGLDESDLEWLTKQILKTNASVNLTILRDSDGCQITVKIKELN
tara:strand:- start:486 stop:692 length:207 start_codon:yes stop_codon:yes gene_type:complete